MAKKKVDADKEAYKSRGKRTGKAEPVGVPEPSRLGVEGDYSDGNDGSKAAAAKPEVKHKGPDRT